MSKCMALYDWHGCRVDALTAVEILLTAGPEMLKMHFSISFVVIAQF